MATPTMAVRTVATMAGRVHRSMTLTLFLTLTLTRPANAVEIVAKFLAVDGVSAPPTWLGSGLAEASGRLTLS